MARYYGAYVATVSNSFWCCQDLLGSANCHYWRRREASHGLFSTIVLLRLHDDVLKVAV